MNSNTFLNWIIVNIPFLCAILILIISIVGAVKNGFVKSIFNLISAILSSIVILLLAFAVHGAFDKDRIKFVVAIVLIVLLGIVYKLLSLFFTSLKFVSKLPIVKSLDKVLGVLFAVCITVIIVWAVYCVVIILGGGSLGPWILRCVKANPVMKFLYQYNYMYKIVYNLSDKIRSVDIWGALGM